MGEELENKICIGYLPDEPEDGSIFFGLGDNTLTFYADNRPVACFSDERFEATIDFISPNLHRELHGLDPVKKGRRIKCEYCGVTNDKDFGTCDYCGAPL